MLLTVVSWDRTRPARFDKHLNYVILVAKYRFEEFFDNFAKVSAYKTRIQQGDVDTEASNVHLRAFDTIQKMEKSS
jgi:hypothetical protein